MFDEILFPTDGSDGATAAFDHVLDVATTHDSTVHVLYVAESGVESVTTLEGQVIDVLTERGTEIVADTADRARARGVDVYTEVTRGEPYETIVEYASAHDLDLVVMPTHGRRGLARFLLGSTTERVLRRSDVPVLTVRPHDGQAITYPAENVLVPTDGSEPATEALRLGADVAASTASTLHLLSVVDAASLGVDVRSSANVEELDDRAGEILDDATALAEDRGVSAISRAVERGTAVHGTILEYLEAHDVDVVVLGTHGRTGFDRYLLGSVTEALVRTSPVPVLTVR